MKKLKILVFDDSEIHRKSAELTLTGHDLTIVGTYDEAQAELVPVTNYDKSRSLLPSLLKEAGLPGNFNPYMKVDGKDPSKEDRDKYEVLAEKSRALSTTYPNFDVVMTDLIVPASAQAMGGEGDQYIGKEMPLGAIIALLALSAGIERVAVVTDLNHHHHPASAAFDCFGGIRNPKQNIICTNRVGQIYIHTKRSKAVTYEFLHSDEGQKMYPRPEPGDNSPGYRKDLITGGKDWGSVLKELFAEDGAHSTPLGA